MMTAEEDDPRGGDEQSAAPREGGGGRGRAGSVEGVSTCQTYWNIRCTCFTSPDLTVLHESRVPTLPREAGSCSSPPVVPLVTMPTGSDCLAGYGVIYKSN